MAELPELVTGRSALDDDETLYLEALVASWQLLSDLCYGDLTLLIPVANDTEARLVVLAQVRPHTGQTLYPEDLLGRIIAPGPNARRALSEGVVVRGETRALGASDLVASLAIPVRYKDRVIALVIRENRLSSGRREGEMERIYVETAMRLAHMIAAGQFPFKGGAVSTGDARVGDGTLLLDHTGTVRFASPNGVSALHRLGIHAYVRGTRLKDLGIGGDAVAQAFTSHEPAGSEVERGTTVVTLRVLPLLEGAAVVGAIILLRDDSDLRRRDLMLLSKDATIREIHHRVKNNLQTIAALLRLQRRRLQSQEARDALLESERRIRSIAIVHETLSRDAVDDVSFDDIIGPLVRLVEETSQSEDRKIAFHVDGHAGELSGDVATPLAVALNEVMQNALDHAFTGDGPINGNVWVHLERHGDDLEIVVRDDGVGLPADFALENATGLGLSIVRSLITTELGGSISMRTHHGTVVDIRIPSRRSTVDV
ncbi:MAG: sensor histidine kinase [Acidimicrobiia bacterium]